jgi:hypothetical protein
LVVPRSIPIILPMLYLLFMLAAHGLPVSNQVVLFMGPIRPNSRAKSGIKPEFP